MKDRALESLSSFKKIISQMKDYTDDILDLKSEYERIDDPEKKEEIVQKIIEYREKIKNDEDAIRASATNIIGFLSNKLTLPAIKGLLEAMIEMKLSPKIFIYHPYETIYCKVKTGVKFIDYIKIVSIMFDSEELYELSKKYIKTIESAESHRSYYDKLDDYYGETKPKLTDDDLVELMQLMGAEKIMSKENVKPRAITCKEIKEFENCFKKFKFDNLSSEQQMTIYNNLEEACSSEYIPNELKDILMI